jgi:hypothetical protein
MARVTLSKHTKFDDQGPARNTQVLECQKALSITWIKLLSEE